MACGLCPPYAVHMDQLYREEDRAPLVLKPENRLAEVVIGVVLMFAIGILLRY